ncbi:hypothetical protein MNBD_PLANCTO02-3315 [hydrothermal vent metagenome]|uniref:Zinc-finger domain-containing protein n=1 Tax=hydrothermal vent metagenome TaxID=652676 RepID=A0A3B1E970_9ZZZZ
MNCDEAFEYLTDPKLRDRSELRWHLELCPRCRQMKDILDPALPLLGDDDDNDNDDDGLSFPEYEESSFEDSFSESDYPELFGHKKKPSPFSAWDVVHLANQSARRRVSRPFAEIEPEEPEDPPNNWIRYFGFFLLGGAIVYGMFFIGMSQKKEKQSRFSLEDRCLWKNSKLIENYSDKQSVVRSCIACHERYPNNTQRTQVQRRNWR